MSFDAQFLTFLIAITVLTLTPGVDTLLVVRNTARGGWNDGAVTSLGICSGLFVHATISAVGISVILLQSAWAFSLLKLAGAAYLIWLGLSSLLARAAHPTTTADKRSVQPATAFRPGRSFTEGFLSNVLNPKAVIFYMAFLPQFIDPTQPALAQSLLLAGIHFCIGMVWQCLLATLVQRARGYFHNTTRGHFLQRASGAVITLLGAKLLMDR
jgi:RhtB (resistance to homoserine/threonine) family protein